jgi:hypothetical protein
LKGLSTYFSVVSASFKFFFAGYECPAKPTLEPFGVEGTEPAHSLDRIISNVEGVEELCSGAVSRNSSSRNNLENFRTHKKYLIQKT